MSADDNARVDAIEQALLARWPETRISPRIQQFTWVELMERPLLRG
jgi:hypothetical protein